MQDIDFDEIDRAVSSVTNPRIRADTPTPAPTQPVVDAPVEPVAISDPINSPAPSPASPSPAVRRSSGRFMDVVHSSSDMRPTLTRPQFSVTPTPQRDTPSPEPAPADEEPVVETSSAFHWPDPIDAHEQTSGAEPVAEVSEPTIVEETADVSPELVEAPIVPEQEPIDEDDDISGPLESPFLADAKVEKRPLGAFSDPEPELLTPEDFPSSQNETPAESQQPVTEEQTSEPEVPKNHETPAEIPRELHDDVLLLEAHDDGHAYDNSDHEEPESHDAPAVEQEEVPVGPTSITQQYKEQPSSADEPSGAIFDTEIYNQALVHTPKSNRRALIIVWIVALILVGSGIGAGIYFIVMPMLG